ncbi:SBBP repeat-containing protein [bacterium]|nr:SBBP repeat-containing protein [bacterium]
MKKFLYGSRITGYGLRFSAPRMPGLIFTVCICLAFSVAGATTDWSRIWGSVEDDYGKDVAVDSSGNIYVTGYVYGAFDGQSHSVADDLFLTKFDKNGNRIWSRIRNNGGGHDKGLSVAIDGNDNILVAGHNAGQDAWLLKFNDGGTDLWSRIWGSSQAEFGNGVAVDSSGNVFVTGYTFGAFDGQTNAGDRDIFLTKFDSAGTKLWTKIRGSNLEDTANDICIDNSGNIYITGHTHGEFDGQTNNGDKDFCLLKFDNSGSNLWTKILGSVAEDIGNGVGVDSSGNVYVGGFSQGAFDGQSNAGNGDLCLIKFAGNGVKHWTRMWGAGPWDVGMSVNVDDFGNIYVAGYTLGEFDGQTNNGSYDLCLTKFNGNGDKHWTKIWGSTLGDMGFGVASDNSGNIFVTGNTKGVFGGQTHIGFEDLCLTKFKSIPEPSLFLIFNFGFWIYYRRKLILSTK